MNKTYKISDTDKTFFYESLDSNIRKWSAYVAPHTISIDEAEKIAKLLAAAPLLYEALEGLVEAYMKTNGFCLDDRLIAAKAALAAAK
jgi:hypothetical protein